ncbi:hypothetical protein WLF18_11700 [Pseudomonas shirazensis]|uniref:Uncharacterized protein n=3 Tax=Pseudomonas TaxID=286 RepID=A0A2S3WAV9_PSEPU|nr:MULTISPECIES: hypothetical protein [Pseudomonas]RZI87302.1 MAG: hypothetical protein EOP15_14690 [Pseudomonas sp.]AUF95271.1 hypothetical protein CXQ80_05245 [Pseudomonas sp. 02C 26]MBA1197648.1 hypothetical protein [Pseudomonas plecoglossicida]MBA1320880.1 hypothetical protein [Pseudomonas plecoglossicida]MBO0366014.1 hypothetical protein [Pseudomonas putida]
MRIDGFSPQSYPIKRAPRKAPVRDEAVEDAELIEESEVAQETRTRRSAGGLPARQQDMVFPRARDRRTATALASYMATAGFTDWDMEVLGLDLYI